MSDEQFYSQKLANGNEGIVEKTHKIQDDSVHVLTCDNGATKNIKLIDKKDIHNNFLQVLNQYEEDGGTHETRYDKKKKTSNSFEFTSYWAAANNSIIADLVDFTKTFFAKHTILNAHSNYKSL